MSDRTNGPVVYGNDQSKPPAAGREYIGWPDVVSQRHAELMETFGKLLAAVNAKNDLLADIWKAVDEKRPSPATVVEADASLSTPLYIQFDCGCVYENGEMVHLCPYTENAPKLIANTVDDKKKPHPRKKVPVSVPALPKKGRRNR